MKHGEVRCIMEKRGTARDIFANGMDLTDWILFLNAPQVRPCDRMCPWITGYSGQSTPT